MHQIEQGVCVKTLFSAVMLILLIFPSFLATGNGGISALNLWEEERIVDTSDRVNVYTTGLHFTIADPNERAKYEDGGAYFFNEVLSPLGVKEALDTNKEVILCGGGEKTFTESFKAWASNVPRSNSAFSRPSSDTWSVRDDSSTQEYTGTQLDASLRVAIKNNAATKDRFCFRVNDASVDYKTPGSNDLSYCDPVDFAPIDYTVDGNSCQVELDVKLKVGEVRNVSQNIVGSSNIGTGQIGCFRDSATRLPTIDLLANAPGCSNGGSLPCLRTCSYAEDLHCKGTDLSWGAGCKAGGQIALINNQVELFNSQPGLIGFITARCSVVNYKAQWIVFTSSCVEAE